MSASSRLAAALPLSFIPLSLFFAACTREPPVDYSAQIDALREQTLANLRRVEGGTFLMGDQRSLLDNLYFTLGTNNKPAFQVTLDTFYMGAYEVSYGEHDLYTAVNGLPRTVDYEWAWREGWREPEYPAGVSWHGAKGYCLWLAEITGLPFDLPTEAQWEFAARNRGEVIPFATDDGTIRVGENFRDGRFEPYHPHPPGTYPPNPLGIYDLSGNVIEWVNDWYAEDYYQWAQQYNPQGPSTGEAKVLRGGSFGESPSGANVFTRQLQADLEYDFGPAGVRCVLNLDVLPLDTTP
ncbi:MAG: SUMF1/EgtB/PvdO family nonheme iron enzyme [Natronospirillum sp.]